VQDASHARSDGSRQATRCASTKVANPSLQCDEAQPVCQRCMKSQRNCYGMRVGQTCPVVHIENSYASGSKKRPRGPRSTSAVETSAVETPAVELTNNLSAVLQPPLVDLKSQAIMYYMHYHLQTLKDAPNVLEGLSGDLMPVWMSRAKFPILDLALSSVALAVFSRTQRHGPAAIEASRKYYRLLQIAQATILSLDKENIDAYLLAIYFMSRYEDSVHCPSHLNRKTSFTTTIQSFLHHDGALAILSVWKDHLSHSQPATDVVKHTRRGMIRSALLRHLALPGWMLQGGSFGEHGLELEYDGIVVRITGVRQRLSSLLQDNISPQRTSYKLTLTAEELNKEAQDIDKALQDWRTHFPSTWCYQRHTLSDPYPWPMRDFYSPVVYSYSSPAYAAVWNLYYATRMLINDTRLRILALSHPSPDDLSPEQRLECLSHIEIMANDLASSVPFCLQRFKVTDNCNSSSHQSSITLSADEGIKPYLVSLIVWPLTIASGLGAGDADIKQRLWFKSELARLGTIVGVGVLECAETEQWLEF